MAKSKWFVIFLLVFRFMHPFRLKTVSFIIKGHRISPHRNWFQKDLILLGLTQFPGRSGFKPLLPCGDGRNSVILRKSYLLTVNAEPPHRKSCFTIKSDFSQFS